MPPYAPFTRRKRISLRHFELPEVSTHAVASTRPIKGLFFPENVVDSFSQKPFQIHHIEGFFPRGLIERPSDGPIISEDRTRRIGEIYDSDTSDEMGDFIHLAGISYPISCDNIPLFKRGRNFVLLISNVQERGVILANPGTPFIDTIMKDDDIVYVYWNGKSFLAFLFFNRLYETYGHPDLCMTFQFRKVIVREFSVVHGMFKDFSVLQL
jgi:hypothetical protein